jgi:hypothetical protein
MEQDQAEKAQHAHRPLRLFPTGSFEYMISVGYKDNRGELTTINEEIDARLSELQQLKSKCELAIARIEQGGEE